MESDGLRTALVLVLLEILFVGEYRLSYAKHNDCRCSGRTSSTC